MKFKTKAQTPIFYCSQSEVAGFLGINRSTVSRITWRR